ncbi:MAG TPA: hypothetical protein PKH37_01800 [Alphaproteobacteria bacterium]|nr:hypothetical protein [Alphaproteobacteria bacterium]
MSCSIIHQSVRSILEEGSTAYTTVVETGGAPNVDYAGYCCHVALNRLRQTLNHPDLTAEQLEGLLRRAARKYDSSGEDERREWSSMMARYLTKHVNANSHSVV